LKGGLGVSPKRRNAAALITSKEKCCGLCSLPISQLPGGADLRIVLLIQSLPGASFATVWDSAQAALGDPFYKLSTRAGKKGDTKTLHPVQQPMRLHLRVTGIHFL